MHSLIFLKPLNRFPDAKEFFGGPQHCAKAIKAKLTSMNALSVPIYVCKDKSSFTQPHRDHKNKTCWAAARNPVM